MKETTLTAAQQQIVERLISLGVTPEATALRRKLLNVPRQHERAAFRILDAADAALAKRR